MEMIHQQLLSDEPQIPVVEAGQGNVTMTGSVVGQAVLKCPRVKKASIIVRVFRADSGQAIGLAKVELSGPTPGDRHTSTGTGTTGFPVVEPGSYSVSVTVPSEPGYEFLVPSVPGFQVAPAEQKVIVVKVACVTWISVVLVDEDGEPVVGERYRIKLSDGSLHEGALDVSGRIRFDQIPGGKCLISFPDLDQEAWAAI